MTAYRYTSPGWPPASAPPPSRWRQAVRRFGVKVADRVAQALALYGVLELAHAAGWQP